MRRSTVRGVISMNVPPALRRGTRASASAGDVPQSFSNVRLCLSPPPFLQCSLAIGC